jgi:hypothetical protein
MTSVMPSGSCRYGPTGSPSRQTCARYSCSRPCEVPRRASCSSLVFGTGRQPPRWRGSARAAGSKNDQVFARALDAEAILRASQACSARFVPWDASARPTPLDPRPAGRALRGGRAAAGPDAGGRGRGRSAVQPSRTRARPRDGPGAQARRRHGGEWCGARHRRRRARERSRRTRRPSRSWGVAWTSHTRPVAGTS